MRLLLLLLLLLVGGPAVPAWGAGWRWPLDGAPAVARPFEQPAHRYAAGHRGADLRGSPGHAVRAAGDGWVSYAGLVAGRGVVAVVHGDLRTTYEPVSAVVAPGDLVAAGDVLGTLEPGHLSCPALACLHWGLRRGDDYLDPVRLVRAGPVRLLPLAAPAAGPPVGVVAVATSGAASGAAAPPDGTAAARVLAPARRAAPGPAPERPPPGPAVAVAAASLIGAAAAGAAAAGAAVRRRR